MEVAYFGKTIDSGMAQGSCFKQLFQTIHTSAESRKPADILREAAAERLVVIEKDTKRYHIGISSVKHVAARIDTNLSYDDTEKSVIVDFSDGGEKTV